MTETLNNEIKYIIELDDFPNYFVSNEGDVYSEMRGKMIKLKPQTCSEAYTIFLRKNKQKVFYQVHRLVAKTFIANPNNLSDVDHINHDRTDNRIENLRWVTHQDNMRNQTLRKDNTSKIQGVNFERRDNIWRSYWHDNNKKYHCKCFSINVYGDKAKQLAIDYRKKMVDELYNRPFEVFKSTKSVY